MTLTERLNQIHDRLSLATPGPWKHDSGNMEVETLKGRFVVCELTSDYTGDMNGRMPGIDYYNDGEFIASAPTDLALLLRIVELYEKVVSEYADPEGSGKKTHFYAAHIQADVERLVSEWEK